MPRDEIKAPIQEAMPDMADIRSALGSLISERASILRRIRPGKAGVSVMRARLFGVTHQIMRIEGLLNEPITEGEQ